MKTGQWLFQLTLGGLKSSCSSTSRNTEEMVFAEYLEFLHLLHNKLGSLSNEPCCAILKLSSEVEEGKKLYQAYSDHIGTSPLVQCCFYVRLRLSVVQITGLAKALKAQSS